MSRKAIYGLLIFLLLALTSAGSSYAKDPQNLQELSDQILETIQSFYPVRSTSMGIHAYDHRFADYSSGSVKDMIKKLNDFEKKLYKYKGARLSVHDEINYRLLKSNVDMALVDLKRIEWHEKSPQLYAQEIIDGVYLLMLSNHAPLSERLVSIMNRMKAVPSFLSTARKNIKKPPPVYIELATETLESAMRFTRMWRPSCPTNSPSGPMNSHVFPPRPGRP